MHFASVDLGAQQGLTADAVLGQHALDSNLHSQLGLLSHQLLVLGLLQATNVAGVSAIVLVDQLVAGQDSLISVDDDDEVTAINMRGKGTRTSMPQVQSLRSMALIFIRDLQRIR